MAETRKKELKKCGVCSDHALGSNFNAITCESCKAFFRRNALKTKDFKCPFNNDCKVDVVTRRFCQKCRLKKCFDIGMKKEWIMTDEEKKAKRRKIEGNRLKKSKQLEDQVIADETTPAKVETPDPMLNNILLSPASLLSPLTPPTPGTTNTTPDHQKINLFGHQPLTPSDYEYSPPAKVIIEDIYTDITALNKSDSFDNVTSSTTPVKGNKFKTSHGDVSPCRVSTSKQKSHSSVSSGNPVNIKVEASHEEHTSQCSDPQTSSGMCKNSEIKSTGSNVLPDSVYAKAISLEFSELPIQTNTTQCKKLSELEHMKIEELVVANSVLKLPLAVGINDPSLLDVINMTDHAIRRLIKMSKKIEAFKSLCQNDQIALLKGGCTELMILRSVMTYDPEKECWRGPHGPKRMSIKVDILKEAKGNIYEEHKRFINSFQPFWRTDENIMLLLSAIALFTPERPNTLHKDVIKLEQDTYYYLLRRYLESAYSSCEAKSSYLKLIHKIQELHILNENHVRVYLDVNPKDVEPLLIEIFDLKH